MSHLIPINNDAVLSRLSAGDRVAFQRRLTLMRYHDADGDDSLTGLFSDSQSYFCETCERCLNRLRAKTRVVAITNLFLPSAEQSCLNPTGD